MENLTVMYVVNLLLVALLLYLCSLFFRRTIGNLVKKTKRLPDKMKETIQNVSNHVLNALAVTLFLLYALSPFLAFNKLLAGAGIFGIVVGFAAQSIIKDMLSGFFRISTKQLHHGDLVVVNNTLRGRVEQIGIFFLQIRQWDGQLVTINNGEVRHIHNFNMDKMRVIVHVTTSFRESPSRVKTVLEEACGRLNEQYADYLLEGEETQDYQLYGLTNTNEQFFGYRYTVVALVKDTCYFDAMNAVRFEIAQSLYDNRIQMAEQHIYFKTRAEIEKAQKQTNEATL